MELLDALNMLPMALASHRSAGSLWRAGDAPTVPEVTVPRNCRRVLPGAIVHRRDVKAGDRRTCGDVAVTGPMRTALDCGRGLPFNESVAVIDALLQAKRFLLKDLQACAKRERGNGVTRLRLAVAAAHASSGSSLETVARLIFRAAGLAVIAQYRLSKDGHAYDFALPAYLLLIEVEGFAFHSTREQLDRDARHATEAGVAGWRLLRFTWEDIMLRPDQTVATIREAMLALAIQLGPLT